MGTAGSDRWGWGQTAYDVSQKRCRCSWAVKGQEELIRKGGKVFRKTEEHGQRRRGRTLPGMVRAVYLGHGRCPEGKKIELES